MGRNQAIQEMEQRAANLGADAIIGVVVDYEAISNQGSNMIMVIASGTAVVLE